MRLFWFLAALMSLSGCVIEVGEPGGDDDASTPQILDGGRAGADGEIPPLQCYDYEDPARCEAAGCVWDEPYCVHPIDPPPPRCDQPDPASCEAAGCEWGEVGCVERRVERPCEDRDPFDCIGVEGCHLEVDGQPCGPNMDCSTYIEEAYCARDAHPCHGLDTGVCGDLDGCMVAEIYVCYDGYAPKAEEDAPGERMADPAPPCWFEYTCLPYPAPVDECEEIEDWDICQATPGCEPVEVYGMDECDCGSGAPTPDGEGEGAAEYYPCFCFECRPTEPRPERCADLYEPESCEMNPECYWTWDADGLCDCGEGEDCLCEPWGACLERPQPRSCEDYADPEACEIDPECRVEFVDADCGCVDCDCGEGWICVPEWDVDSCEEIYEPWACQERPECQWFEDWDGMPMPAPVPCDCEGEECHCADEYIAPGYCGRRVDPNACEQAYEPWACEALPGCQWFEEDWGGAPEPMPCACEDPDDCACDPAMVAPGYCAPRVDPTACEAIGDPELCWSNPACDWDWYECGCPADDPTCACDVDGYCFDRAPDSCEVIADPDACEFTEGCEWAWDGEQCGCDEFGDCFCEVWGTCHPSVIDPVDPCLGLGFDECSADPVCEWFEEAFPCDCAPGDMDCACAMPLMGFCAQTQAACEQLELLACEARADCEVMLWDAPCRDCPEGANCECDGGGYACVPHEPQGCEQIRDIDLCVSTPGCEAMEIPCECEPMPDGSGVCDCNREMVCVGEIEPQGCEDLYEPNACVDAPGCDWVDLPCDCPEPELCNCIDGLCVPTPEPPSPCAELYDPELCESSPECDWVTEQCICEPGAEFCDDCESFSYCAPAPEPERCDFIDDPERCEWMDACAWVPAECECPEGADCDCWGIDRCVPVVANPCVGAQTEEACSAINGCGWFIDESCGCPDNLPPGVECDCNLEAVCAPLPEFFP